MNNEFLSINTCQNLKRRENAIKYIKYVIKKSFDYDYGLDMSNYKDQLSSDTIIELQKVLNILEGKNNDDR